LIAPPSLVPRRLTGIIEAIELIRSEVARVTIEALGPDRRKRWLVERGIEIVSASERGDRPPNRLVRPENPDLCRAGQHDKPSHERIE
jgi:hypothetical protein